MNDPKSINARDIPRNRDANAAGESCEHVENVVHQGWLLECGKVEGEEGEEKEEAVLIEEYGHGLGKGKGNGGNLRV